MGIISQFVREQKRYTKGDLIRMFQLSNVEADVFISNLKAVGVLKAVKNNSEQRELTELVDEDIEVSEIYCDSDDYLYIFTYVGVITIGSRVIKSYPKYLILETISLSEIKLILKVISRFKSRKQTIRLYNGDSEKSNFNLLAVILFLLNDYHDYGIYNNTEDITEVNGEGTILWDKTVNEGFSLVSENKPYYLELYTEKTIDDEVDFFKRLHEYILTECFQQLESCDLIDLFDIVAVNLSEESLNHFGDREYILYRIQAELNIQFNTRKQILLKTMYAYIEHNRTLEDSYGMSMYGTNNFNLVWEDVCAEVFSNNLETPLGQLDLPIKLTESYQATDRLIDIIKRPSWEGFRADGSLYYKSAQETLIPDIITITHQDDVYQFNIMDAKYYNIQLEEGKQLRGQPGVGDITKQYLYELAYKNFLDDHDINRVKNCFLMPTQTDEIKKKGLAKMIILSTLGLQDIQVRQLPANKMYEYYLNRKTMNISALSL